VRLLFSSRRRHTSSTRDWSSDVCSSDLVAKRIGLGLSDAAAHQIASMLRTGLVPRLGADLVVELPDLERVLDRSAKGDVRVRVRSEERRVGGECGSRVVTWR